MFKPMLKSEFARDFYGVTVETLRQWIKRNPELVKKLEEVGYNKYNKLLKPKVMEILQEYL